MRKPNPSKRLVLYADDDSDDLDFVRKAFKSYSADIELKSFSSAIHLLQFIRGQREKETFPCLIILDINMPILNGKDALRLLRSMEGYHEVPVILFSTSVAPHDQFFAGYYKAGFFTKPLNERQMITIVEKFLDHCNERVKK